MIKDNLTNKNILIIRLGKIGDIIVSSFVFEVLKNQYHLSKLTLITLHKNKDVLKYNPQLDKIIYINKNIFSLLKLINLLPIKFDIIFELNDDPSTTSSYILKYLRGKIKIGYTFDKNIKHLTTSVNRPDKTKSHIVERAASLIEGSGIKVNEADLKPIVYIGEQEKDEVLQHLKHEREHALIIAINISAGAQIRYWKEEYWIQLIQIIYNNRPNVKFLILSIPKDDSQRDKILSNFDPKVFIIPKYFSFQHFASYINFCDLLISPDTSAIHIASAFQKPVIGLYPNYEWSFVSWQPYKTPHRSLKSPDESISAIQPEEVYSAFLELTDETQLFKK